MRFVCRAARRGDRLNDPLAETLLAAGRACEGRGVSDVPLFLALETVFPPELRADPRFTQPLIQVYDGNDSAALVLPPQIRKALRS
jgi:fructuronate reductase